MPHFLERLKTKWKLNSQHQVWVVLLVFACTGFTVMFIRKPILNAIGLERPNQLGWYIVYFIAILPVYQIILLFYGALFGQFKFFWDFEKRMLKRMFWIRSKKQ